MFLAWLQNFGQQLTSDTCRDHFSDEDGDRKIQDRSFKVIYFRKDPGNDQRVGDDRRDTGDHPACPYAESMNA